MGLREASPFLLSVLLLSCVSLPIASAQQCFYPDGTPSIDKPCGGGPGPSACCGWNKDGSQAWCLKNGLCMADLKLSRGSCTDKTWQSSACAQQCKNVSPSGGWMMKSCPVENYFTCDDCDTSNFTVSTSDIQLSAAQVSGLGLALPTATVTAGANAQGASNGAGASGSSSGPSVMLVGVAVGASLGAALIGALFLFAWERRKNNKLRRELRSNPTWPRGWSPPDVKAGAVMSRKASGKEGLRQSESNSVDGYYAGVPRLKAPMGGKSGMMGSSPLPAAPPPPFNAAWSAHPPAPMHQDLYVSEGKRAPWSTDRHEMDAGDVPVRNGGVGPAGAGTSSGAGAGNGDAGSILSPSRSRSPRVRSPGAISPSNDSPTSLTSTSLADVYKPRDFF